MPKYAVSKLNNPIYALQCLGQGMVLLSRTPLRRFVLIPVLINLILFTVALFLAVYFFAGFLDQLIPSWLEWLRWGLWPLLGVIFALATFFSFALVANVLASPFYARLAERAEELWSGTLPKPPEANFFSAAMQEVTAEVRRLSYFLPRACALAVLTFIPGVNFLALLLWLAFNAWFLSLECCAYPLANHGVLFPQAKRLLKQAWPGQLVFGTVLLFGLGIPMVNLFLPPAVVVGATIYLAGARLE